MIFSFWVDMTWIFVYPINSYSKTSFEQMVDLNSLETTWKQWILKQFAERFFYITAGIIP